jgi:hypothetical protein
MTPSDRKASARLQDASPRDQRVHGDAPSTELTAVATSLQRILQNAAPDDRDRLLALARVQGLIFGHQLPSTPVEPSEFDSALVRVLNGRHVDWLPLRVQSLEPEDLELDVVQRDAVAKALQTPDVCLIQGFPGTGKRRVAREIIRQAAKRGERVLLVSPRSDAVDCLLEQLASSPSILAIRCLGRGERPESLPPVIRRLLFANQLATLKDQALEQASREATNATARAERSRCQEPLWIQLTELSNAWTRLMTCEESLSLRKVSTLPVAYAESEMAEPAVNSDSTIQESLGAGLSPFRAAVERAEGALKETRTKIASLERECEDRESFLRPLRNIAEAKRAGRWWTPRWWRALVSGNQLRQIPEVEAAHQLTRTAMEKGNCEARELAQEVERLKGALQLEKARLIEAEQAKRRAEVEREEEELHQEREALSRRWAEVGRSLEPEYGLAKPATPAVVRTAHQRWLANAQQCLTQAEFARDWAAGLRQEVRNLDRYLRTGANLVGATPGALAADEQVGAAPSSDPFDFLLVLDAQELNETDLVSLANRARRVVLVGQSTGFEHEEKAQEPTKSSRTHSKAASSSGTYVRLWQALHCDPRRLPYTWLQEGPRLCCRLRSTDPDQRRWVETECLHDFPEMELRILAPPRKAPVLVEILFPIGYSIQQAKEYVLRELEEWPVSTNGSSIRWDEQPERIVLRLAETSMPGALAIALEPGVREMVGEHGNASSDGNGAAWHTCCVEFERAAGWQRESAEQWIQRRLGLVDLGRTAQLNYPHRMQPALARSLSHILFNGQSQFDSAGNGEHSESADVAYFAESPVVFVPVVGKLSDETQADVRQAGGAKHNRKRTAAASTNHVTSLALECNLSDPRQRSTLPEHLRTLLPRDGIVNLAEAQAVIHSLESLIQDPSLRAHASQGGRPVVGVIALYSAQAELIRRLIQLSSALSAAEIEFVVADPTARCAFECSILLVSLTRSSGNMAVSVGDGPHRLIQALTRATDKVLIFGDLDALQRRCHWDGPVESLDEATARNERAILARLIQYVNGSGALREKNHILESSTA